MSTKPEVIHVGANNHWKPLALVSPNCMTGPEVYEAQYLLTHNRFKEDFKPGKMDGVFGPKTAHATLQAKYWLGYNIYSHDFRAVFGSLLRDYLLPKSHINARELPLPQKARRRSRLNHYRRQQANPLRLRAFHVAMSQVGYSGANDGHCSKYSVWYGLPCSDWCAEFVSWCISQAGTKFTESYVPTIVDLARLHQGMALVDTPSRGDLVCYDWQGDGVWDHVEFFDEYVDQEHLSFMAVGGNTGEVNGQPGGQVLHQARASNIRHCFVSYQIRHPA